jgi:hypoxanthine phosphoribosyltransferase
VLLDKQLETPSDQVLRLRADLALDYVGFRVPDRWLAGYGLDAAGEYRDLPCIAVLREEFFTNPSPP